MSYTITKAGTGLNVVTGDGFRYTLPDPVLDYNPDVRYPATGATLLLSSGQLSLRITQTDTVTVGGSAGAGTLAGLLNQILSLL